MSKFESDLITLEEVIHEQYFFNIPIYQRLYVWGKEQIHSLLDDIVAACEEKKNEFYLGGTLVIERASPDTANSSKLYDLIDGQQRFTTLWLISVILGEHLSEYRQVQTEQGVKPRINFAIRPQVTAFFEKLCCGEKTSLPQAKQLEDALQFITSYFDNTEVKINKIELTNFIRTKVLLILTKVPKETDLNKLFEVINNRGVQLQHHEILKATLLETIEPKEREAYALLWDACSDMNGYVERHLRTATQINNVALYEGKIPSELYQREQLSKAQYVIASLQQHQQPETKPMSLDSILNHENTLTSNESELEEAVDNGLPDRVSSIISFSMLLQHTLRIYLQQNPTFEHKDISKISDKDLVQIFRLHWLKEQPNSQQIKKFFELLWDVRYQFDKHIIKWVLVEEEKQHAIRHMFVNRNTKNKTEYLQRSSTDADPDFALLQSMLYHSQQMTTQYWLTPLLKFLLENNEKGATLYLQHLDNQLLCSEADAPLIVRTHRYLVNCWHTETIRDAATSLNQVYDNGTKYPHYWFYKLEYVLYLKIKGENKHLVENFKMTAKSSVEHVTPQHPRIIQDAIPDNLLHTFGNLALVTTNINSEMTDDGFTIKKAKFQERHKGKSVSLKLEDIYENTQWKETEIMKHCDKMIIDFNSYIEAVENKVKSLNH